ncbi:MAG: flagellar FliJ family protein [Armatimonadetes bacterium]|nr:flagellar FliJ family protein [Armatimonadota bacterium]
MRRFRFRLESVLQLRELREREAEQALAKAWARVRAAERDHQAAVRACSVSAARLAGLRAGAVEMHEVAVQEAYHARCEATCALTEVALATARQELTQRQEALRVAAQASEALRRLRAEEAARHRYAALAEEQKTLDDLAPRRPTQISS